MEIKCGLATFWRNRDWNEKQEVELQNDREGREEMPDLILYSQAKCLEIDTL